MMKRLLSTLLALAMLLAMVGCTQPGSAPAETTAPGIAQFTQIYLDACTALEASTAVTLDVKLSNTMLVEDQSFVTERQQVVTYSGLGTENVQIKTEETVDYAESEDAQEEAASLYTEIYNKGTVYVTLEDSGSFCGQLSQEESVTRYVPVSLLDPALYGDITMKTAADGLQSIYFAAPTAAEAWAVPAQAELLDASGLAEITADGIVKRMQYTVSYRYGTAQFTCEVETTPREQAASFSLPEDADSYTALQYPQALYSMIAAKNLCESAQTATYNTAESYISYAGGVELSDNTTAYMHGIDKDMQAKIESSVHIYSAQGSENYENELIFKDGKVTLIEDGGLPTIQTGVTVSDIKDVLDEGMATCMVPPSFWQDVTITELSGVYLLEFTFTEDFGNNMQNMVCQTLFQSPSALNQLASAYENKETTGYLSVEKYTGLAVAAGMYFEGSHTIEGSDYLISVQVDQSFQTPAYGAYHEITDEYLEDAKPENPATPLFYKVTGENGQQMWLLGTIHVGDERTAYLPQEIYDAIASSKAIALEIDNESLTERLETDTKLQSAIAEAFYYQDGSTADAHLEKELYEKCVQYLKATGNFSANAKYMKHGIWKSAMDMFFIQAGHSLRSEQGVEQQLTRLANEHEIPIWEVEDVVEHAKLDISWSEELQLLLLEESMETDLMQYTQEAQEMYELWCGGDEAALQEMINSETDTSEFTAEELAEYEANNPLMEEYEKGMQFNRNEQMLTVAKQYLESGDVVFYAVGLAHLLDDANGLVEALRAAGYTVEIVTYK